MTQQDVFESRLRAALVRNVANGPTEFDALAFARTVAAEEPRRRGIAASLTWQGVAFPRRAWALLLLAGLLAAMVAGTLLVGSQFERKLRAVVPPVGQVYECPPGSTPDKPGPIDQAPAGHRKRSRQHGVRPPGRQAGGARRRPREPGETWTFDVCTNTWTRMRPEPEPPTGHWPARLRRRLRRDDHLRRRPDVGLRPRGRAWTLKGPFAPVAPAPLQEPPSSTTRSRATWSPRRTTTTGCSWNCGVSTSRPTRGPQSPRRRRLAIGPDCASSSPAAPRLTGLSHARAAAGSLDADRISALEDRTLAIRSPHRHLVGDGCRHAAGFHRWNVGAGARDRLRRGGAADRDVGPGPISRLTISVRTAIPRGQATAERPSGTAPDRRGPWA